MLKIYIWIKYIFKYRDIIISHNLFYSYHYIYYNKLLNEKNYKQLHNNYPFYFNFFFQKFKNKKFINLLTSTSTNDDSKIFTIKKNYLTFLKKFNLFELNFIYNFFRLYDSFVIAHFIFDLINHKLISSYKNQNYKNKDISKILNATIYLNDLKTFELILKNNFNDNNNIYYLINKLIKNKNKYYSNKNNYNNDELNFKKYIKDNKIYILGPNYNQIEFKEHINEDDICIFTNTSKYTNINHKKSILYINSFKINNFFDKIKIKVFKFQWICFKSNKDFKKFEKNIQNKLRIQKNVNYVFNHGSPMLIQNIILDLLFYLPKKILLTGIDFYLFGSASNNDYKNYDKDSKSISKSIREHDIFENKKTIEFLVKNKLIESDDTINQIFEISDYYFCKMLDYNYKKYPLL